MENKKQYTLSEMEDRYIGKKGSPERDKYEFEIQVELLSRKVQSAQPKHGTNQEHKQSMQLA
ncbi:MAG: hypothetical protein LBG77_03830 [Dysgonamonadaceae bacterium]|jgi:hypothetical protein|nr:hypothetical protein [Dysgonamonadaceae bacterium]